MRVDSKDPAQYLRAHLGDSGLSYAMAKPSLEDVFIASTNSDNGGSAA